MVWSSVFACRILSSESCVNFQNVLKSKFIYATIFLQLNVFPEDTVDVELLKKGEIYMEVNMKKKDDGFLHLLTILSLVWSCGIQKFVWNF